MSSDKRLSFLKTQFSKIDETTFDQIISADPTSEKKYSTWLLRLYSKSKLDLNDLSTLTEILQIHFNLKESIPVEFRDINKFDSVIDFLHSMNVWLVSRFVENENNVKYLKNGGELLFENENISIIKVLSFEGSVSYGSGTKWCTLKNDTFYEYSHKGSLYIIIPKNNKYASDFGKKSQLHFGKSEFRNHNNDTINLINIICKNPELYELFKKIDGIKQSTTEIGNFFFMEEIGIGRIQIVKKHGFNVLKFLKTFSREFIKELFVTFGEEAYKYIPDSKEKTISFVSAMEDGLKKLLKKNEIEIDDTIFREAVIAFPENILLMDCENEELWEVVVSEQAWLIKRSPFIKDSTKLFKVVLSNFTILKYISAVKVFDMAQKEEIAKAILKENCDNYLEFLTNLGQLEETVQLSLVKIFPECLINLVSPSEKVIKLSEKLIKDKEKKLRLAEEENNKKKRERERQTNQDDSFLKRVMDDYYIKNKNGWNPREYDKYGDIARVYRNSAGDSYFETVDGDTYENLDMLKAKILHSKIMEKKRQIEFYKNDKTQEEQTKYDDCSF